MKTVDKTNDKRISGYKLFAKGQGTNTAVLERNQILSIDKPTLTPPYLMRVDLEIYIFRFHNFWDVRTELTNNKKK